MRNAMSRSNVIVALGLYWLSLGTIGCGGGSKVDCSTISTCATAGATQCSGNRRSVRTCKADANGCLIWQDSMGCDPIDVCDASSGSAQCVPNCTSTCDTKDALRCQGTVIEICSELDNCLVWTAHLDCTEVQLTCDSSTGTAKCAPTCQDECASGSSRCQGTTVQTCQESGGCLKWMDAIDCHLNVPPQGCRESTGGASCVRPCSDQCIPVGTQGCDGTVRQECQAGSQGCNVWVKGIDCGLTQEHCELQGAVARCVRNCTSNCDGTGKTACSETSTYTCIEQEPGCLVWTETVNCSAKNQGCRVVNEVAECFDPGCTDLGSVEGSAVASGDLTNGSSQFELDCINPYWWGGNDRCFMWRAPDAGTYRLDTKGSSIRLGLSIRRGGEELRCAFDFDRDWSIAANVDLQQNDLIMIVVDSLKYQNNGTFVLNIAPGEVETDCANWVDDDSDGLIDCADPTACQGQPACVPGTGEVGTACTAHTDCAANAGDPACNTEARGWPAGYCSEWCDAVNDDCPGDAVCVQLQGAPAGVGLCMERCDPAHPCRTDRSRFTDPSMPAGWEREYWYFCCPITGMCQPSWMTCPMCGNGVLDKDFNETCDGADLGGATCTSLGFDGGGELKCGTYCTYDTSGCLGNQIETLCDNWQDDDNNGLMDCADPACAQAPNCQPGSKKAGESCQTSSECASNDHDNMCFLDKWGWPGGYCTEWCKYPENDCPAGSTCIGPITCQWDVDGNPVNCRGYCLANCSQDPDCRTGEAIDSIGVVHDYECCESLGICWITNWSYCSPCGNGVVDNVREQCDKNNLDGQTCQSFGFVGGGPLLCNSNCLFDTQNCTGTQKETYCADGLDNDGDKLTDCSDPDCQGKPECQGGSQDIGTPCTANTDCHSTNGMPACLLQLRGWPGGYCTQWCTVGANDCPAGSVCEPQNGLNMGICAQACSSILDCRPDQWTDWYGTIGLPYWYCCVNGGCVAGQC